MSNQQTELEAQLLFITRNLLTELNINRAQTAVCLEASIARDLGIDSLSKVELLQRVEKSFDIQLSQQAVSDVESLNDLLQMITKAKPAIQVIKKEFALVLKATCYEPAAATNLVELLINHAQIESKRPHVYLQDELGEEQILSYGQLLSGARKTAKGLIALGLQPGQTVAIMLPSSHDFFYAFYAILLAGGIPVPIYPPVRASNIEEYIKREATILNDAESVIMIAHPRAKRLRGLLLSFVPSLIALVTVEELQQSNAELPNILIQADTPALIQYTSGSTGDPKGVLLSHQNLLANIKAIGDGVDVKANDVSVSWLPLYHDMGLIGAWLGSLYHGVPLTLLSPLTFLTRPERWLWAIHYHRGTVSGGPNFAYELCVRKIEEEMIEGLDLSSWRIAFNGAEAINPQTIERFITKFEPYGFKPAAMFPAYGLAENCVAVSFSPVGRGAKIDSIARDALDKNGVAEAVQQDVQPSYRFVSCGRVIPQHELRIVGDNNNELTERKVGQIQFKGPSTMSGYYHKPEATQAIYHHGWVDSGDYGYLAEGELYITGRKKDLIIAAGRNLYPEEIESIIGEIDSVRNGCVIAFGVTDEQQGTEKLIIVAECRANDETTKQQISQAINTRLVDVLDLPPQDIILIAVGAIPKTSSGKLQRATCKQLYLDGKLTKVARKVWWQMLRLASLGALTKFNRLLGKIARTFYTAYAMVFFLSFLLLSWLGLIVLPRKYAAKVCRFFSRALFRCLFCPIEIKGKEHLVTDKTLIYTANHASYLDSIVLMALLPSDVFYVAHQGVLHNPMLRAMVKKLGYLTVDRLDIEKSLSVSQQIEQRLQQGHSLAIYPEGTFTRATGLRPFKMGAFKMAVETHTAICPIAIKGMRSILRSGSRLLRPGKITVTVMPFIEPQKNDWQEVTRLHQQTRDVIATHCGEASINLTVAGLPLD